MSERQYRQRGYQDDPRDRERQTSTGGARPAHDPRDRPDGPKTPNLMASHQVSKCARCGYMLTEAITADSTCLRCSTALHSCVQCVSFDPGSTLECTQPIKVRVSPKDERNDCTLFEPRTSIERQTSTAKPASARQAFDDLFNF
jgi:hypothetical protein